MGVSINNIARKPVIVVDCSNPDGKKTEKEIMRMLKDATALVSSKPEKSVYIITNVTGLKFNSDVASAFKQYAAANTKYIKESVIVGLGGMQTVVFAAIKTLTKRDFHLSGTMKDAEEYLKSV